MSHNVRDVHILGGGTFNHVRAHLALAAPAFGSTAKYIAREFSDSYDFTPLLHLTKMASNSSHIVTNDDVSELVGTN